MAITIDQAWEALRGVPDPEVPALSVVDLERGSTTHAVVLEARMNTGLSDEVFTLTNLSR